jgi:hypothetical membrane protein
MRKFLLACGILSSLYYIAINIIVAMQYEGYDAFSLTVSELSAIGTPTRSLWIGLLIGYSLLVLAFGWGLIKSAGQSVHLRTAGILMIVYVIIGLFWPPMHQRAAIAAGEKSLTDTLHIVFTFVTVPMMMLIIGFSAAALGKGFRLYSLITILLMMIFGIMTGLLSPELEADQPTPWMGVWERISIGAYMIWIMVLGVKLLRYDNAPHRIKVT